MDPGRNRLDVELLGEMPKGARPDLSIEGTVELARSEDVLYMGRPISAREESRVEMFKLDASGDYADRILVRLGKSSVNFIEVLEGLLEGDRVVLSDM